MRPQRTTGETGALLAGVGGVLLLVSLFLAWYTLPGYTITAWTAFEVWDLVLAVIAVAVVLAVATELGWWRGPAHSLSVAALGAAAFVIVGSQLIDRPPSALHSAIGTGGWLALVGAGATVVGALLGESRITVSFAPAAPARPGSTRTAGRWAGARRRPQPASDPAATPTATPSDPVPTAAPGDRVTAPGGSMPTAAPGDRVADPVARPAASASVVRPAVGDPVAGRSDPIAPTPSDPDETVVVTRRDPGETADAPARTPRRPRL
jgi:hypothetical protein